MYKEHGHWPKGDRVIIYMPMIPEAAYGHVGLSPDRGHFHSIVFAGFRPDALLTGIVVCEAQLGYHRR